MADLTRRNFLANLAAAATLPGLPTEAAATKQTHVAQPLNVPPPPAVLPGTEKLDKEGDLAAQMVEGIRDYLLKQTNASVEKRQTLWQRDLSSREAYESSIKPNRERFRAIIGLQDPRTPKPVMRIEMTPGALSTLAVGPGYKVYRVRWPVFEGVEGEGLLLDPETHPVARVVALPDADWSPEMLIGLAHGTPREAQFARRLAENGCQVVVPTLINRADTWSGNLAIGKMTNLTHREYIYRMSYDIGRHIIGYEVQRVLAVVDAFASTTPPAPIGVFGYGEGGLIALYSAASDTRINATAVSGYFDSRQNLWQEPLYRNVWSLLHEFGDAGIASLIAPRRLIIEASRSPEIDGPPPARDGRLNSAASGRLRSPALSDVQAEIGRAKKLGLGDFITLAVSGDRQGQPGSEEAVGAFVRAVGSRERLRPSARPARLTAPVPDSTERLHRQFQQLVDFTQHQVIESERVRKQFWSKADASSVEEWKNTTSTYRRRLWEEIFGKLPEPPESVSVFTRTIYQETGWTGYEVYIPLWPEVYAYGILLLPRFMASGERRPVVVCQHGLEGRPQDLIKPPDGTALHFYHAFAADLANHGFVIYCPQNPYIGGDKFRKIQRLANPLKLSLFSFILSQHQRTLRWLAQQPFVDADRIGFYGLSYGGKTAIRVPPLLDQYALSICSGDFNEWIWKVCRDDAPFTYPFTQEYDVCEFNLGNTFNHSDMAKLMTPRPFMVERGHDDGVSVDAWVAYEYAKVRKHYDELDLFDRTQIEYFNGPHTIHGVGTYEFLHHHLGWGEDYYW